VLRDALFLRDHHLDDVLSGRLLAEDPQLRNISIAFWSYGLHEKWKWENPPYGVNYYNSFVQPYLRIRQTKDVPLIWTSINEHCAAHDPFKEKAPGYFQRQTEMVREANNHTRHMLRNINAPYYDLAAPLRTPQICDVSADGLHVKMWVDVVRAQILLNYLCDENNQWVGSAEAFI
jgi:hypothetical protein